MNNGRVPALGGWHPTIAKNGSRASIGEEVKKSEFSRIFGIVVTCLLATLALSACVGPSADNSSGSDTINVPADAPTIAEAAQRVKSGQTILIAPGTYKESVVIDVPDVTVAGADRNSVILDGEGKQGEGILVIADGVSVQNLTVKSYLFNGILVTGLRDGKTGSARGVEGYTRLDPVKYPPLQRYSIDSVTAYNNGLYGVYVFNSQNGVVVDSYASGSADSGFYLGQCVQCNSVFRGNVAENNAVGFENANASDSVYVVQNNFSDNRVGATFTSNYQEAFSPQTGSTVVGNVISSNNQPDSPAQAEGGFGIGLGVAGGTQNIFSRNLIENNQQTGISVRNTEDLPAIGNQFIDNSLAGNPLDYADLASDRASSRDNCLQPVGSLTVLPPNAVVSQCPAPQNSTSPSADSSALPQVTVPSGVPFLRVTAPPEQPNKPVSGPRQPLPGTPELPDAGSIGLPTSDYLSGNKR